MSRYSPTTRLCALWLSTPELSKEDHEFCFTFACRPNAN